MADLAVGAIPSIISHCLTTDPMGVASLLFMASAVLTIFYRPARYVLFASLLGLALTV